VFCFILIVMERKIIFSPGEYYHVYNRGVEKRKIFLEDRDYNRFLKMLFLANGSNPIVFKTVQGLPLDKLEPGERVVAIGAFVLMPNHFHILVKERVAGGLTNFMLKLTTGYAMYFNKKYERVGSLFQSRFKAEHVDDDDYLKYLFSYIHLNPIKIIESSWKETGITNIKKAEVFLNNYRYSSYPDYVAGYRPEKKILNLKEFPNYFENKHIFANFHKEWLVLKANYHQLSKGCPWIVDDYKK